LSLADLQQLLDQLLDPMNVERLSFDVVATVAVLLFAFLLYLIVSRMLRVAEQETHLTHAMISSLRIVTRWLFMALTIAAVLQVWGVLDQFWAAASAMVALIAIGFVAVWSVLSNVLCSIILLAARPFQIGDTIELPPDNIRGVVVEVTLVYTVLHGENGIVMKVPNNMFFQRVLKVLSPESIRLENEASRKQNEARDVPVDPEESDMG
jgi:small-conductance mechanosensitive channel